MRFHSGSIQPECQNASSNIWRHYHRYVELGQVNMQENFLPIYLMFFLNIQFVEQVLPNVFGKTFLTCFGTQCTGRCWCAMTGDDGNKHAKVKNQLPLILSTMLRLIGSEFHTLPGRNIGLSIHAMGAWQHWSLATLVKHIKSMNPRPNA